jgi:CO/xanthine dehydrogenase Mo-binding subunit
MRRADLKAVEQPSMTVDALAALDSAGFSRRGFLKGVGALMVSFNLSGGGARLEAQTGTTLPAPRSTEGNQVDSWIVIGQDDTVTGYAGKCDFGQGFRTVQQQLIAEELGVALDKITMVICDTALTPDQGVSSGSQGHPTQFGAGALRQALATAREMLFQMASTQFSVPVTQLEVKNGVISMKDNPSRSVSYGRLIGGNRFNLTINARATPKDPSQYTILGTSVPRYDIPAKVTGQFQYVQHVRVPGMLHGRVVRPPAVGSKVVSIDESSLKGLPGNPRVVRRKDFVGVVADTQWAAIQASQILLVNWSTGVKLPSQADLYNYMRKQPSRDAYSVLAEDTDQTLQAASRVVKATYLHPYQAHGSLGTSCAVADVKGTGSSATATIWSATQGVYPLRDSAAMVLNLPKESVRVIYLEGSGCYGLNGADTVAYDAAVMSQETGRPVRVQYTRPDEMTGGESFGPAYVIDLRAGVDDKGQIMAWDYESWTLSKGNRPNVNTPGNIYTGELLGFTLPAFTPAAGTRPTTYSNNGNSASSYGAGVVGNNAGGTGTIRSERILTHTLESPFFTGPLRSPNRLQNTFANESFIDEVAAAVKADPVEYRLRHLTDQRLKDVITGAAKAASWDTRPSPKPGNGKTGVVTGRGMAAVLYEGNNGYCALVAEVEVDQDSGVVTVRRFVASGDSGPVSNPDGLRNQMEGGAMQGMSRALHEEIRWNDFSITSTDWRRFPVFQFGDPIPVIETVLVNRPDKPQMGAGETTITIAAAAIANAVFDATGARLRQVPFTPANVLAALANR